MEDSFVRFEGNEKELCAFMGKFFQNKDIKLACRSISMLRDMLQDPETIRVQEEIDGYDDANMRGFLLLQDRYYMIKVSKLVYIYNIYF